MNDFTSTRTIYEHRQVGWVMLAWAGVPILCLVAIWTFTPSAQRSLPPLLLPLLTMAIALVLINFSSMSIVVTTQYVVARFGLGLVKRTVAIDRIVAATVVRTRWYEGWGIHWTPRGMLYNVAGRNAVHLELDNGNRLMFGSDEAERLQTVIERARQDSHARTGARL